MEELSPQELEESRQGPKGESGSEAAPSPDVETLDHTEAEPPHLGWGFLAFWVLAHSAAGAVSCRLGAEVPWIGLMVAPAALLIFGVLVGMALGFALRRQDPPVRRWILAGFLAGLVAATVSFFTMLIGVLATQSTVGLVAGWACAWAVYGAVIGGVLSRIIPGRPVIFVSTAGWAVAGIVGGLVGWAKDLWRVTRTTFVPIPSVYLTSSLADLFLVGAVYGAAGGAITGAVLIWLLRRPVLPPERVARKEDTRRVAIAGGVSGLIAAVLCSYVTPLVLLMRAGSVSDFDDLANFFGAIVSDSVFCLPVFVALSITLSLGGGYAGLIIGRARGEAGSRSWIWGGAVVGGVLGYVLGSLLMSAVLGF